MNPVQGVDPDPAPDSLTRARALLGRYPIVDGHNDLPFELREISFYDLTAYDIGQRQSRTHTDLVRLREGGVGAQFWSVFVPAGFSGTHAVRATLEQIDVVRRIVARYPDRTALATTAAEVRSAWRAGKLASLMGAEGGHQIDESLGVLRALFDLGVRYLTLTHNQNVPWADSATDVEVLGGLNDFGRSVVAELNRLGMLVDLSHVSPGTMRHALDCAAAPVLFSHSSARAICDHPRNVPDEILARLPVNGGVCMVTFVPYFISEDCRQFDAAVTEDMIRVGEDVQDWYARMGAMRRFSATTTRPVATVAQVADHIEHVREIAGVAHVGIGGDYDGCDVLPEGLEDVSCYPRLIAELIDRGWSDEEIRLLSGENALRVLSEARAGSGQAH
ncbi:dipeptidase [Jatrophihabitans telluris]|uniref:Dipeptidase n=1 Tax=Jatrophihabitans telluris TaxID=2038343 RepID=A0ABY4QZY5_9ACTN|nr:dipeptidase [Jatrophihabitans telluris]UQX89149.1 dipeptidase [Jatrophihabitans telluris]